MTLVGAFQPVELAGAAQDELAVDVEEGEGELHVEFVSMPVEGQWRRARTPLSKRGKRLLADGVEIRGGAT